jgi:DNA-damage-inducible protein J
VVYSESNLAHLRRGVAALNAGKGVEHDTVEAAE